MRKGMIDVNKEFWYAVKVFYDRVPAMIPFLVNDNIQYYIPMHVAETTKEGLPTYTERPLIPSLIFIRCAVSYFSTLKSTFGDKFQVYSHIETKHPQPIPEHEMNAFMLVTSAKDKGLELLDPSFDYRIGDRVRVIDGMFKGAEGYVRRIKGRKRLIVAIEGVAVVVTSYIPQAFLERL